MNDAEFKARMLGKPVPKALRVLTPAEQRRRKITGWSIAIGFVFVTIVGLSSPDKQHSAAPVAVTTAATTVATTKPTEDQSRQAYIARTTGELKITDSAYFGCQDSEVGDKLISLIVQRDRVAFGRMLSREIMSGQCRGWKVGETVYRQQVGFARHCLRPAGEEECYWTPREAVENH